MRHLIFLLFLLQGVLAQKSAQKWRTLSGDAPVVIARGGYSGLFPDSSQFAYEFALSTSLPDVIVFCDLQLTKDGSGICKSDLRLDNSTNIAVVYPKGYKTYSVNGESVRGWFSVDFTANQLFDKVTLTQNIFSRPSLFDGSLPISMVEDVQGLKPPQFWLNVQYDMFYKEHDLDVVAFIKEIRRVDYISSPEIGFLKNLKGKSTGKTKLVFRFLDSDAVEPTTKKTYGSILKDLASIKTYASGILVPKDYILPVSSNQYLNPHTTLVVDAHKQGLEVFASDFANDYPASFNYSYDPTAEYLQFIDDDGLSVDGFLTDFPSTASEAIACLSHNKNKSTPTKGKPLIITHNGASGIFAGSTDLAYQQAAEDGADIIDCSVQMTKDGVALCLNSADLMSDTTAMPTFMSRSTIVPEIQKNAGIFSFDLTWNEIQSLQPSLVSPVPEAGLARNPAVKNQGKFIALSDFLEFAKDKAVPGVLINIQNAPYLASKKGLSVTDAVIDALSKAGYGKGTAQQVLIQSDDSAVLSLFKKFPSYKLVLLINEIVSSASKPIVEEIKQFADAVNIPKASITASSQSFLTNATDIVKKMHAANISVYASVMRNEFMTLAFDFFADPMVELATYIQGIGVEGVVTEYPGTASAYFRSPCFNPDNSPYSILPVQPGALLSLAPPEALPPSQPPEPALTAADVIDPPLPPVAKVTTTEGAPVAAPPTSQPSGQTRNAINVALCLVMVLLSCMSSLSYH